VSTAGLVVGEVTVTFGGLTALNEVSLSITPGEVVGVIGPNGAGKTTLFNVICGFVRPTRGRLEFNGNELRRHHPHDLARLGIARTLQSVGLWPGLSVLENVVAGSTAKATTGFVSSLLGLPRAGREEASLRQRARAVLGDLGIGAYEKRLPAGLPYAIQKRVALARALVNEPVLLLLDEPASGLSEAEMDDLAEVIRRLRERMSVLLVEHHMDLVMSICQRIVVLDFGRVIAAGTPSEIKADAAVTRAYLGEEVPDAGSADMDAVRHRPGAGRSGPGDGVDA